MDEGSGIGFDLELTEAYQDIERIDLRREFYFALLEYYLAIMSSPVLLDRICWRLYEDDRFSGRVDTEWITDMIKDLNFAAGTVYSWMS
jgi:hypothetical protein